MQGSMSKLTMDTNQMTAHAILPKKIYSAAKVDIYIILLPFSWIWKQAKLIKKNAAFNVFFLKKRIKKLIGRIDPNLSLSGYHAWHD